MKKLLKKIASFFQDILTTIFDSEVLPTTPSDPIPEPTWTKESSFALVIAHDYRRDTYPVYSTNKIRDIMSESADTVKFIVDADATTQAFLDALKEGINYKTFFFYINGHGNNKCIRLADRNVLSKEVWEVLRNAQNRIVGFFDACYSGSMIVDPEAPVEETDKQSKETEKQAREIDEQDIKDNETMADYLIRMFNEQPKTRDVEQEPQLRLYSACENFKVTTYEPESSTKFANAILTAHKKTAGQTYADFDKLLIEKGSYGNSPKIDEKYHIVPQIASYGKDFSDYERFH